jgi:hypothetical protein
MSSEFEQRLERELVAAARREAARAGMAGCAGAGAPGRPVPTSPRRRPRTAAGPRRRLRPRPLPVAAVALLAIVALVVAVVALPGSSDETPRLSPAATPLPRQCDDRRDQGVRLTRAPVDPRLRSVYGVLRRPQTAADRSFCPVLGRVAVNPAAIRLAGTDADGRQVFLVPVTGRGEPIFDRGPQLCIFAVTPRRPSADGRRMLPAAWGGGCGYVGDVHGDLGLSASNGRVAAGVLPDGVATMRLRLRDGREWRVPVRENFWTYRGVSWHARQRHPVVEVSLLDRDGAVLRTWRGGPTRGFYPPAALVRG